MHELMYCFVGFPYIYISKLKSFEVIMLVTLVVHSQQEMAFALALSPLH